MSARRERKVVTVLFADLVGFTARADSLDPEDVEAILRPYHERLRAELERFGGTVEKFIGDAVMALFGAPTAHEDDPERAVRAALAIRDWAREEGGLEVRIGITTGEALVSLDASPAAGEGMASGDVVNTAARLQAAAGANGIFVDDTTYRATERLIDYRAAAPVEAKGKAEPIGVWEPLQARSRLEVDVRRPRAALVGRERELDVLVDALARVRDERSAQLVTIVGEPGIGKSRLTYELFQAAEAEPDLIWWRQGRSLPYGEGVSFWALGEMVKTQAGILETDPPDAVMRKLADVVEAMEEAEWIERHLRALVGVGAEVEAGADREEAFAAWRRFFEALAEQRPLVLVFEDLHWADEGLLDFVDHLVDWTSGVPILVVGSARPELLDRRPGWGGGKRNSTTISLAPLGDGDTARLLGALTDHAVLPPETEAVLLQRAGGNPLYAEEFARMLEERAAEDRVPETLQGLIAARLDGLATEQKALLQRAAVVGKIFWLGALEAMDGMPRSELEQQLHALARKEFVRRERRSSIEGDSEYTFLHVLVRDVAYGQIPRAERAEQHERAARWIESLARAEDAAEMLAHHYGQALDYATATGRDPGLIADAARRALAEAGDRAFTLRANDAASRYYASALELWPRDDPERGRLLVQRANALHSARGFDAAAELGRIRDELAAAGDRTGAAEVAALLSHALWVRGERDGAVATLREALAELDRAPLSRAKAAVLFQRARLTTLGGEPGAVAAADEAFQAARELRVRDLEARALNTLGVARVTAGDTEGLDDLERSLALAEEIRSPVDISRAYTNLASITFGLGELERSFGYHVAGMEASRRWGLADPLRWLQGERPEYDYEAGRWDDARRAADEFIAETEVGSSHYTEPGVRGIRALLRLARGDRRGASEDERRQLELARSIGDPQVLHPSLATSSFVRVQLGDRDEAEAPFAELRALLARDPSVWVFNPSVLAFAAVALARSHEFLEVAEAAVRPTLWLNAASAFARGEYAQAAELFGGIGSRPNEAYALLHARGPDDLERALAFYRSVGAVHYVRQAEARLPTTA